MIDIQDVKVKEEFGLNMYRFDHKMSKNDLTNDLLTAISVDILHRAT